MAININPRITAINGQNSNKQIAFKSAMALNQNNTKPEGSAKAKCSGGCGGGGEKKFPWWVLVIVAAGIATYGCIKHNKKRKEETIPNKY